MDTIAIMGATGKVGRATIRRLQGQGVRVRAIVRDPAKAADLAASGCEIAVADARDTGAVRAAVDGARAVQVIVPTNPRSSDPVMDMKLVIESVTSALGQARPETIVAISDYGAHLPAGTGVTLLFHHFEERLRTLQSALTFVRSAEHMQNWLRFVMPATEMGVLPSMHLPVSKVFPTVSAPDVGVAAGEMLLTPILGPGPRILHVEGPRRYSVIDVASALGAIIGREVTARELPRGEWAGRLKRAGMSDGYALLIEQLYDAHNAGKIDVEPNVGEVRRGTSDLHAALSTLR